MKTVYIYDYPRCMDAYIIVRRDQMNIGKAASLGKFLQDNGCKSAILVADFVYELTEQDYTWFMMRWS